MSLNTNISRRKSFATAFSKLFFCWKITADISSFFKLVLNTKRAKGNGDRKKSTKYTITLFGNKRDIWLRTYTGDISVFYAIFWHRIYQVPDGSLDNAATILDIGAHTGMTSLFFHLNAPQAKIYAVEPDDENYGLLSLNLKTEIKDGHVTAINAAINSDDAVVYLEKATHSYNTAIAAAVTEWNVQGITIGRLLSENNIQSIDVIKIDIEGAEKFLLNNHASWMPLTKNIVIEIHTEEDTALFLNLAKQYKFKVIEMGYGYEKIYWAAKKSL